MYDAFIIMRSLQSQWILFFLEEVRHHLLPLF